MGLYTLGSADLYREMLDPMNSPIKPLNAVNPSNGGGGGKGMAPTPDNLNPDPKTALEIRKTHTCSKAADIA